MIPVWRICEWCEKPFETVTEGQTVCTPCLLKPSGYDVESKNKEENMADIFKEKNCLCCGNMFRPTSPSQKRCPECIKAGKQVPKKEPEKQKVELENNTVTDRPIVPAGKPDTQMPTISRLINEIMNCLGASSVTFTIIK
jgi:hypothetical protein